jgi:hypothetical protein
MLLRSKLKPLQQVYALANIIGNRRRRVIRILLALNDQNHCPGRRNSRRLLAYNIGC